MVTFTYKANENYFAIRFVWLFSSVVMSLWAFDAFRKQAWFDGSVVLCVDLFLIFMLGRSKVVKWNEEFISIRSTFFGVQRLDVQIRWQDVKQIRYICGMSNNKICYRYFFADGNGKPLYDIFLNSSRLYGLSAALHKVADARQIPVIDEYEGA